ncbi:MAG: bifunctional DNA-formamidopyrimidine glycosylase/DNA-(apurinic or apyrimidinic site) lyase [Mariprofundaceae bacterium]|nr:bifunctional DNA-formamidopyrimidine glycosylase/DNA-(apurinic or apyrimidinic site) lyase [Mariprofundaceae bacterium]
MPELPEVEVICRGLSPLLVGQRISSVELMRDDLRFPLPVSMVRELPGLIFTSISRRSRYLLFHFDRGPVLIWHLGMTGQFHVLAQESLPGAHEHVRVNMENGRVLCYRDARRFGYAGLSRPDLLAEHKWFSRLGPEPLQDSFSAAYLTGQCTGRRAPVKSLLMDAHVVAGIGNIYASEVLFRSGIHPARAAGNISEARVTLLTEAVRSVLGEAIAAGGSSISDFVKVDGSPGYFSHQFRVYGRQGEPCYRCGRSIRRMVQSGRSTFYCPGCQH